MAAVLRPADQETPEYREQYVAETASDVPLGLTTDYANRFCYFEKSVLRRK